VTSSAAVTTPVDPYAQFDVAADPSASAPAPGAASDPYAQFDAPSPINTGFKPLDKLLSADQAIASGLYQGAVDLPSNLTVDTLRNTAELGKAAAGTAIAATSGSASTLPDGYTLIPGGKAAIDPQGKFIRYTDPATGQDTMRMLTTKVPIPAGATAPSIPHPGGAQIPAALAPATEADPGSSEWLNNQYRANGDAALIDPVDNTPVNRYLHSMASTVPSALVGNEGTAATKATVAAIAAGAASQRAEDIGAGSLAPVAGIVAGVLTHGAIRGRPGVTPEELINHNPTPPEAPSGGYTAEELMGGTEPPAPGSPEAAAAEPEPKVAKSGNLMDPTPPPPKPADGGPQIKHEIDEDSGQHVVSSPNGQSIAQEDGKYLRVQRDDTAPAEQGKGEGTARWQSLGAEADARGLTLASDVSVSPAERATMARYAARTGGQEIQDNNSIINPDTGNSISQDPRTPAFEIKPEPAAPLAPADAAHLADPGVGGGVNLAHPQAFTGLSAAKSDLTPEQNVQRTNQLRTDLQSLGAPYSPTLGNYMGSREPSFMVASGHPDTRAALEGLAQKYGQESVMHVEPDGSAGFKYMADGHTDPMGQWTQIDHATARTADGWTRGPGKTYFGLQPKEPTLTDKFSGELQDHAAASQRYAALKDSDGGRILNTDTARELSPEYVADKSRSAEVHEPASAFIKQEYANRLAQPVAPGKIKEVAFTAGGTGAGKSTAIKRLPAVQKTVSDANTVYDTNMNKYSSAKLKVEQALAAGHRVNINYVHADPMQAFAQNLIRASHPNGRTVPLNKHADTHNGAFPTVQRLSQEYANDPRVQFHIIDNTGKGVGEAKASSIDAIAKKFYTVTNGQLQTELDRAHAAGEIDDRVYKGSQSNERTGRDDGRGVQGALPEVRSGNGGQPERGLGEAGGRIAPAAGGAGELARPAFQTGRQAATAAPQGLAEKFPNQRGGPKFTPMSADEQRVRASLSPEEQAQMNRGDVAKRVIEAFHNAPKTEELGAAALAGKAKKGWYDDAANSIHDVFQEDAPRFSALLAAMSPQTSVEMNFHNALRTFINWDKAGRPTDAKSIHAIMGDSVLGSKKGDSVLDAWKNNSVRALAHPAPDTLTLSGPKVDSFMGNLQKKVNAVTLDSWMAKFAGLDAAKFGGSLTKGGGPGKSATYLGYSAKVREAAKMLTEKTGEKWSPAEIQEAVWSWAKTASETADSYKGMATIPELVRGKEITDEHIRGTSDFHSLFSEPGHANALANSRFADNAARASGAPRASSAATTTRSEAEQSLGQTLEPHLQNAAERLEGVRTREETEATANGSGPAAVMKPKRRLAELLPNQRGGPKFTPPPAGSSGVAFPPPPEALNEHQPGVERPKQQQALVADTLRAIGLDETRQSAITGNWRESSGDWQTSLLKNTAGNRMADVLGKERKVLTDYAQDLVNKSGGTAKLDRDSNHARGRVIAQPVNDYRNSINQAIEKEYTDAKAKTNGSSVATPALQNFIGDNRSEFLGTVEGKQLLEGLTARAKELGVMDKSGKFQNAPIERIERLRQYAGQQWSPRTAKLIDAVKDHMDADVTAAAGKDVYAKGRALRALRSTVLDEPEGISGLLDPPPRVKMNRDVAYEDVPNYVTNLPVDQFNHLIGALKASAAGSRSQATAVANSLNEIRAQFANKVLDIGQKNAEAWDVKGVSKYLNDNLARMQSVFKPEEIQRFKTLNAAGNYLHVDRRYKGAAAQAHNYWVNQVLGKAGGVMEAGGAHFGGLPGYVVGHLAGNVTDKASEAILKHAVEKRLTKL
jgi:hypothetical protein